LTGEPAGRLVRGGIALASLKLLAFWPFYSHFDADNYFVGANRGAFKG
jgi:hypothetical protein